MSTGKKNTLCNKKNVLYTRKEVETHNTAEDCWVIYNGYVYNLTEWLKYHPGSPNTIVRFAGMDVTDEMRAFHPNWVMKSKLPQFLIGVLKNPEAPSPVQSDFRNLMTFFEAQGYFKPDLSFYFVKCGLVLALWLNCWFMLIYFDSNIVHFFAAVLLGVFFQQTAFIGHDTGHCSVNVNRAKDTQLGLIVGNLMTGISIGWWKATHNTHHAVPNSVFDDPDIAHLPLFAVNSRMFDSLYNTYHERVMPFDWLAKNVFIPYQHFLYYPIMMLARVNLYVQGILRLTYRSDCYKAREEWTTMFGFFLWMGLMLYQLNSTTMCGIFLFVSHAVAGILQVQITLSHFSKPVNEGKSVQYGGDFYTRNIIASMDVDCYSFMDWFHGGLQFQTLHHCFPRMGRQHLRKTLPYIKELCRKHGIRYSSKSFFDANVEIYRCLRETAQKSRYWAPQIWDSVNAQG